MKHLKSLKKSVSRLVMTTMILSSLAPTTSILVANANKDESTIQIKQDENLDRRLVGYFPEWAYRSAEHNYFDAADLQWDSLTNIQYSFAEVDQKTNKMKLMDTKAALEEDFEGMDLNYKGEPITIDESLPYKGHFNIIQQMKKRFPDVQVTMSVGGWAASRGFYTMLDTDEGIDTFVQSCVDFVREYNFDGIDIDFEFPSSTSQSGNPDDFDLSEPRRKTINARYNIMMKKLNEALDKAAEEDGKEYLCTAAVSASSWVLGGVESNAYAKELDFLSVMSYDYHGGWNEFVENQANIYPDPADRETAGMIMPVLGMDWSYKYYRGVLPAEKILMGVPYYTRGWENVQGGNGTGLHGSSKTPATGKYNIWGDPDQNGGIIPAGANPLWHVLNLMEQDPNLKIHWDEVGKVPYVWQNNEKVFLTFENEQSIDERLKYIEEKNLGGALIWVMDGDYGLNPNYVEGSTDINEGKYTFGDTLTKKLSNGLKEMGPAKKTEEGNENLQPIAVEVEQSGTYDHPNYTYDFNVTNHTKDEIQGGWELSFDLPKSAVFKSAWGGQVTEKDNGDFTTITIKSSGWQKLAPGESTNLQGMIGLCFSGVRNITFNGMNPVGKDAPEIPESNTAPVLNGVNDATITVGDKFDKMAGVTAIDKQDGNLTDKIKVSGDVDTNKAGKYTLTYSVEDSEGLLTTKDRVVTVKDVVVEPEKNEAPVLNGITNKTITVGDKFDKMAGVTAIDKEDGNLTDKINVSGEVDVNKARKYELTYSVEDSKGLVTTAKRIINVQEVPTESGDTYDSSKIYLTGDTVIYKGEKYTAKWWVQGEAPDQSQAWEKEVTSNEDGTVDYYEGMVCIGGDRVVYNGKVYEAKWWTSTTPGSDDSWKLIG